MWYVRDQWVPRSCACCLISCAVKWGSDVTWHAVLCELGECGSNTREPSDGRAGWGPVSKKGKPVWDYFNSVKRSHTSFRVEGSYIVLFPPRGWLVPLRESAFSGPSVGWFCWQGFMQQWQKQASLGERRPRHWPPPWRLHLCDHWVSTIHTQIFKNFLSLNFKNNKYL